MNCPPLVDASQMRSHQRVIWRRLDRVPPGTWMRWPLRSRLEWQSGERSHRVEGVCEVPVEELKSWSGVLPRQPACHFQGFISSDGVWINFQKCLPGQCIPRVNGQRGNTSRFEVGFHSQPIHSSYSDIPLLEDVYLFIKLRLKRFFSVGKSKVCLLMQDDESSDVCDRLLKWEAEHPYHISRLIKRRMIAGTDPQESADELFQRYTYAALRGIGLKKKWPDKLYKRRDAWPDLLRSIGLSVQVLETAATNWNSY